MHNGEGINISEAVNSGFLFFVSQALNLNDTTKVKDLQNYQRKYAFEPNII